MFHYILLFLFPAIFALLQSPLRPYKSLFPWIFVGILYILFIGFRYEVGGDWFNYLIMFNYEAYWMGYSDAASHSDPAYWVLMVLMHDLNWKIYGVNVVAATIFMTGLIIFIRKTPNPWLGLTIAVAYMLVVVSIGYVRQGIALGFILWAIVALEDRKFLLFLILVILATMFHKTAIIMIALGIFGEGRGKFLKSLAVVLTILIIWQTLILGEESHFIKIYIDEDMQSSGAYIRVFMNFVPSLIFLYFRKKWKLLYKDYMFWLMIALGSILSVFLVGFSSTAVDRMALYFIPIQIIVFTRLPILLKSQMNMKVTTIFIIVYYAFVYFIWLNFAAHSYAWLPYENIILPYLFG